MPVRVITLDRGDTGVRLDRVLLRHLATLPSISRTRIQSWIRAGAVRVNGHPARRVARRVTAGDAVHLDLPELRARRRMEPEARPLDILYEDDYLLAVNKPAGLVAHPSYKHASGTLMNAIIAHAPGARLIHRLDKLTSGLVLVAKVRTVQAAVQRAMGRTAVVKEYLAVVFGKPSPARGMINLALDRDPWDRRRVIVRDRGGVPSVTTYQRIGAAPPLSLVCCRLITGRMHQIRVHLSARGWPIVGDPTYGPSRMTGFGDERAEQAARAFTRQALHAWRLRFEHPVTGAAISLEADLPTDLAALIDATGLARRLITQPRQALPPSDF